MGGWSDPANGLPADWTGMTRCSGIHTDSKPSRSASQVNATQAEGRSTPREIPIFTTASPS